MAHHVSLLRFPPGASGSTTNEAAAVIGAYEQLLVLLFDCSLLAESGALDDFGSMEYEQFLSSKDSVCKEVLSSFLSSAPASDCVHAYMLLLRTVGVALALKVDYLPLQAMFAKPLLDSFPRLLQVRRERERTHGCLQKSPVRVLLPPVPAITVVPGLVLSEQRSRPVAHLVTIAPKKQYLEFMETPWLLSYNTCLLMHTCRCGELATIQWPMRSSWRRACSFFLP